MVLFRSHACRQASRWVNGLKGRSTAVVPLLLSLAFSSASAQQGTAATSNSRGEAAKAPVTVSVPYVTNRRFVPQLAGVEAYTGGRGEPHFGYCQVEFKPIPLFNQIVPKLSFYVPSESKTVKFTEQTDPRSFWNGVTTAADRVASRSVVLFVHGYNYDFERTCLMVAEMQRILHGKAIALMFSWPSNGKPTDYVSDQADVEWSVPILADTLTELGDRLGPMRVNVLTHSLGSRGTVFALERLKSDLAARPVVDQLVFVAPDFDAQTFVERLPRLVPLTNRITLYASDTDTALKVSQQLHGAPRLGEAGEFLTVADGMQTVDVSPAGRYQALGHEYFYFQPQVAADLAELLGTGKDATQRPGLRSRNRNGLTYWEIIPAAE